MTGAARKDAFRTIKKSLSRFLSILLIIAIGVGFFAGIRATGSDMRTTASDYFNDTNTLDIQLLSSLGFSETDLALIRETAGVEKAEPGQFLDCFIEGQESYSARVFSLSEEALSSPESALNRLVLQEGRLPEAANECVIDPLLRSYGFHVGGDLPLTAGKPGDDLCESLHNTVYKIVGVASSPRYIDRTKRGNTTIGDGSLDAFLYIPEENFDTDIYTEVVLRVKGASELLCYGGEEYPALVTPVLKSLEKLGEARGEPRLEEVKAEAQEKIDDAKVEISDARAEITDAKKKLADAKQELEDGRKELADGEKEYEEGLASFHSGVAAGRKKLAEAEKALKEGEEQLAAAQAELEKQQPAAEKAAADLQKLDGTKEPLNNLLTGEYKDDAARTKAAAGITIGTGENAKSLKNVLDQVSVPMAMPSPAPQTAADPSLTTPPETPPQMIRLGDLLFSGLGGNPGTVTTGSVKAVQSAIAQMEQGVSEFKAAEQLLQKKAAELEQGKIALEQGKKDLAAGIASGSAQLDEAAEQLEKARRELADGERKFKEKSADAYRDIAQGEKDLAEGERELKDAENDLAKLEPAEWFVNDRASANPGFGEFGDDADRMDNIAAIFPVFFLAVAALVCLTTMARMVEEHRTEIGTFKALGYGASQIRGKYLLYSLSATVIGCVVGLIIGFKIFPTIIYNAYRMMYDLPEVQAPFHWSVAVICCVVAISCVLLVTYSVCHTVLRESPASIMRPKAPPAGKRVLLERVPFLWNRLSFSHKVTIRNLFRYKKRVFMTVFGIAGSAALILTGFGLHDAIGDIISKQFTEVFRYDLLGAYPSGSEERKVEELYTLLEESPEVKEWMAQYRTTVSALGSEKKYDLSLTVSKDQERLTDFVTLQERRPVKPLAAPEEGVILTEKLAELLDVSSGDTIRVEEDGDTYELLIAGITENYAAHFAYLSEDYYRSVFLKEPEYNSVIITLQEGADHKEFSHSLLDDGLIQMISSNEELFQQYRNVTDSLSYVVAVLIISAGLLAFIVLYNLSNINICERVREIATLKVLGFYDREVSSYIYRENNILTLLGTAVGLLLGTGLTSFVVHTAEIDSIMFGRNIYWPSYAIAAALTILFSLIVNWVIHYRLKKISMVESMKSID